MQREYNPILNISRREQLDEFLDKVDQCKRDFIQIDLESGDYKIAYDPASNSGLSYVVLPGQIVMNKGRVGVGIGVDPYGIIVQDPSKVVHYKPNI